MNCATFLPNNYQQMLLYAPPGAHIMENIEMCSKIKNASPENDEDEKLSAINRNLLLTEDVWREQQCLSSVTSDMDLAALVHGSVKCRKGKPPSTKQTRKEAFDRYMNMIYGLPPNIKVDLEDIFIPDKLSYPKPCKLPTLKEDIRQPEIKLKQKKKAPAEPKTLMKVKPRTPILVKACEESPVIISPIELPKTPLPRPKPSTPPPPPEPTSEVPVFLKQFADGDWFKDPYPNEKNVPSTLSPEDFCLQLLDRMNTCSAHSKMKILAALQALHSQGLLQNPDRLYQGIMELVPQFARPPMSPLKQAVLVEMLNLLMRLKSASYDFVKKLLTLLAFKKLGLRETVLSMLTALAVTEAEQWLMPELESWDSALQDQSDIWKSLHDRADLWLELWISKYKEHNQYLNLRSTATWKPSTISIVDVLNYFCSVQKEEYRKAQCVAPAGCKNAVLLPLYDCSSQPIFRLGETHSMARVWRPPGVVLPPLRNRPFLTHFPSFISLPLPRVTLCPFHVYSDKDWVTALSRRYFIPQQSFVEYYR